ncbi:TPA: hypothetical protein SMF87_004585 [Serratia marcescens]|nr:hypothetical protein [Serratia marcescens]
MATTNLNGSTTATFAVTLSVPLEKPISVKWNTEDGTGKAGVDYEAASGTLEFAQGETSKAIQVVVYGVDPDAPVSGKTFLIRIVPPSDAIVGNALTECTIVVTDDEGTPVTTVQVATGPKGLKGDPGLSAYELAKLQGYEGTLEDWMNEIADASQAAQRAQDAANSVDKKIADGTASAVTQATAQAERSKSEADRSKAQADRADVAASVASTGRVWATTAEAIASGLVPNGGYFNVLSPDGDMYAKQYQNVNGTAVETGKDLPSGQAVRDVKETVFLSPENSNILCKIVDANGAHLIVILKNGKWYAMGQDARIQEVAQASAEAIIYSVINETSLLSVNDSVGGRMMRQMKNGDLYLPNMITAIQKMYAFSHEKEIRDAVNAVTDIDDLIAAANKDKSFYALDNTGKLTTQGLTFGRVTKDSGFLVNGWPQGKSCADTTGRIYQGFNRGSSHVSNDKLPVVAFSDDMGKTWSEPVAVVTGKVNARGTDAWALGVDDQDRPWTIVRNRGASNAVGSTYYEIYRSDDRGVTWTLVGRIDQITQSGNVPELFHDLEFMNGRFYTAYHFASSSRVGFLSFSPDNPLTTMVNVDVISHGDPAYPANTTVLCEATITADPSKDGGGVWLFGGLRTQVSTTPPKMYFIKGDLTGFEMFDAPESVRLSPVPVKRVGDQMIALMMERYNTGQSNLWIGSATDFYLKQAANFYKVDLGKMLRTPIPSNGSTNQGVQDMVAVNGTIFLSWAQQFENGDTDIYCATFNPTRPNSLTTYEFLEKM